MVRLLYIDLFCGSGGTSTRVENARYAGELVDVNMARVLCEVICKEIIRKRKVA